MSVRIQFRGDTAANWTSADPTLMIRELGVETDTDKFKIGDGATAWTALPYGALVGSTLLANLDFDGYQAIEAEIKNYVETLVSSTWDGATHTVDLSGGNVHRIDLEAAVTTLTFTNPQAGAHSFTLIIDQDDPVRAVTWPASVDWNDGTAPDISVASAVYILTFITTDSGTTWLGFLSGGEFA